VSSLGSDKVSDELSAGTATGAVSSAKFSGLATLTLFGGILAGLVSFAGGEAIYQMIPAKLVWVELPFGGKTMGVSSETAMVADTKNAALAFGVLGACLGGFLGMAGGLARRSALGTIAAGLAGVILGGGLGAGVSHAVLPYFLKTMDEAQRYDLLFRVEMHSAIWGLLGAVAGLAFAIGLGRKGLIWHAVVAGLVGAVLGVILYDVAGETFFPGARTCDPISNTSTTRLLARLFIAVGTAIGLVLFVRVEHVGAKPPAHAA
jgi:hypothetical protein